MLEFVWLFEKTKEKIWKYFLPTKLRKTNRCLTDDRCGDRRRREKIFERGSLEGEEKIFKGKKNWGGKWVPLVKGRIIFRFRRILDVKNSFRKRTKRVKLNDCGCFMHPHQWVRRKYGQLILLVIVSARTQAVLIHNVKTFSMKFYGIGVKRVNVVIFVTYK